MTTSATPSKWWLDWNYQYANPDVYGPLKGGHTIQEGFYNTLQKWLPAYLAEFNRNLGGEILSPVKEYRQRPDFRTLSPKPEASMLVVCDSTIGKPERRNSGTRSTWAVKLSVFMAGTTDWQETQALTYAYGAAARAAISQHPSLGGIAETTLWVGERYLEKEHVNLRTIGLLVVDFETTIADTLYVYGGPPNPQYAAEGVTTSPSLLPPDAVPVVDTATVTVVNEGTETE